MSVRGASGAGPAPPADVPLGGQAVLEGVMMRAPRSWAVALREPGGGIEVTSERLRPWAGRSRVLRLPLVRGVAGLAESLKIGLRALAISAEAQARREDEDAEEPPEATWGLAAALLAALAVGLFFVLPAGVALLLESWLGPIWLFLAVETVVRVALLLGYIGSLNRSPSLRRTFQYHGAEHKAIACREAGDPLTPQSAARHSRLHPRCGTSFLLTVMVLTALVLAPLGVPDWHWLLLSRVLGIPVVVGVSYEAIKWMGRHRHAPPVRALAAPGLMLQRLTTREPDHEQLEVAIVALERVLEAESSAGEPEDGAIEAVA